MNAGDRVGYVIPEWPGQTHLWIWREICHMREFGVNLRLFATRRPPDGDRSRHAFTQEAIDQTTYLWPMGLVKIAWMVLYCLVTSPIGFLRCVHLAFTLPIDNRPAFRRLLPLIVPACRLAYEVRRDKIKHLHSHVPANCTIMCMMVKRLTGVGYSQMVNANIEWWGGAMREKFREARFTTFCTQWMVDQMRREFSDIDPATYGLCRVAVDVRKWTPAAAGRQAAADGSLRILSVGRLVKTKAHEATIQAIALLRQRGHRVNLRIGGEGPEREGLTKLIAELGVGESVTLLGSVAEDQYLAEMLAADVFVLVSKFEPMGVVYMEAMATATATIGTTKGGVSEIITHGVDGLLAEPMNPEGLADAIERFLRDPAFRESCGRAGREKILRDFDSREWAAELYRRIFGRRPAAIAEASLAFGSDQQSAGAPSNQPGVLVHS